MDTLERLKELMTDDYYGYAPADQITENASFIDDLGMDSLDMLELVMFVEEEFNIEVSDGDAELCLTVGDAVKLINRLTA